MCLNLWTNLAGHYRDKEEASTTAKGVDFTGNSLDGFAIVSGFLQFQHSPITYNIQAAYKQTKLHDKMPKYMSQNWW